MTSNESTYARSRSSFLLHSLGALVLAVAGCGGNPYFDDDEGSKAPDSSALGEHPDHLSLPYAAGTEVGITVQKSQAGWTLKSDTPSVLSVGKIDVDDKGVLTATCTAGVAGQARISAVDASGSEQRSAFVRVVTPDSAKIVAHGPARLLSSEADPTTAQISDARVLTGGTGVVAVAYFKGSERVFGRGIAQVTPPVGLAVENNTAKGLPVTEFLFLKPTADGTYSVDVNAGGQRMVTLPVTAVPETAIAALGLQEQASTSRNEGDAVWVLAQAADSAGKPIYGAYSTWTLGGVAQTSSDKSTSAGDLFRYKFGPSGTSSDLVATLGSKQATLAVHAQSGEVKDTTYLGCNVSSRRGSTSAPALVLVLGCVGFFIRRSARKSSPSSLA